MEENDLNNIDVKNLNIDNKGKKAVIGIASSAVVGAAIGTAVPIVGSVVGAAAGGIIGSIAVIAKRVKGE